ncbi:RDD family protein [Arenimonas fontis]|uniref:RDD family protein n=1 Tax=Arenimonas fontis TaxID=2608255 RepID=A0A5B2ZCP4_9GAMM|nr:RDD family protein [Arenimonas fontis]KAA2284990.1 RDD family protein [Arenimonas fontis]
MSDSTIPPARPAHLGWRLVALLYDFFPVLALWFAGSGLVLLLRGGAPVLPDSPAAWAELAFLWAISGAYAVLSWRRGGQTLGMRPWRLKVVAADGRPAGTPALALRYLVATLSLAAAGLGFLWCLVDSDRRAWHDLASRTVLVRLER